MIGLILALNTAVSLAWSQSPAFPMERLQGLFSYQEHFDLSQIRRAETVFESVEGRQRIKELRGLGYTCIRKNPQARLCSKTWKPQEIPEGLDLSVRNAVGALTVRFEGGANPPELVHDGSTTQEWEVSENIEIGESKLRMYRVVRTHEGLIYIAFPVNQDQALSPLKYHNQMRLGLTLIGNIKDTPTSTTAYTIEAFLEK